MNKLFLTTLLFAILCSVAVAHDGKPHAAKKKVIGENKITGSGNQDCVTAKPICKAANFDDSGSGAGDNTELNSSNAGCFIVGGGPGAGEHQSSWYYFKVATAGTFGFTLYSDVHTEDYDFALWGPNASCPMTSMPIRCNTFGDTSSFPFYTLDSTGLSNEGVLTSEGPGSGRPFCTMLPVSAGEIYYLLIDNYSVGSGFHIRFTGTATLSCDIVQASIEFNTDTICAGGNILLNTRSTQTTQWYTSVDTVSAFSTNQAISVNPAVTTTYIAKGTNDALDPYRLTKIIVVNPLPVINITTTNDSICIGGSTTLTATGGNSYKWATAANPFTIISSSNILTVSPGSTTQYIITATLNGCSSTSNHLITVVDKPTFTVLGNDSVCPGFGVTYTGSSSNYTYQWANAAVPSVILGTGQTFTVTPTGNTAYIATATFQGLCSDTRTFNLGQYKAPIIMPTYVNSNAVCIGSSIDLKSSGAITYDWKNKLNGLSVATGSLVTITPTTNTTYTVIGTDAKGCTGSSDITVTVNPLPSVFIYNQSGSDSVCSGNSITLLGLNAINYQWSDINTPSVILSSASSLVVSPTVTTTYQVTGTDGNGCSNIYSRRIFVRALPVLTASTDTLFTCPGITHSLSVNSNHPDKASYEWYDLTTSSLVSSTTTLTITPTVNTSYLIKTTDSKGCTGAANIVVSLYAQPITSGIFAPTTSICPGYKGFVFHAEDTLNGSTYKWFVNGGKITTGQATNKGVIKIDWNNTESDSAYVKVIETSSHGCIGDTVTLPIKVEFLLHPPTPTGLLAICSKDATGNVYSTPAVAGSIYTWTAAGGTVVSGQGSAAVTVNWDGSATGLHKISYREDNGPCYGLSQKVDIAINPTPSASSILGLDSVCSNASAVYGINGLPGSGYVWWLSKNTQAQFSRNDSTSSTQINWPAVFNTLIDSIYVIETSDKGCKGDTVKTAITITPPHAPDKILGPDYVCIDPEHPTSFVYKTYSAINGEAGSKYVWSVNGNGIHIDSTRKDSVFISFDSFGADEQPTIQVYEISKDSCIGRQISKVIRFDFVQPYIRYTGTKVNDPRTIEISWDSSYTAVGNERTYNLFKRKVCGCDSWHDLGIQYVNHYLDTAVTTSKYVYEYLYKTMNICEDTTASKIQNTILLKGKTDEGAGTVTLNWNSYQNWKSGVLQYEVWRRLDSQTDYFLYAVLNDETTASFSNGNDGFVHRYRVRAIQNTSPIVQSWSNELELTFEHHVEVPNVITPNGDGNNDTWKITGIAAYKNATIEIFSRWGTLVYSHNGVYQSDWSGTSTGKDLPDGVYFYVIKLNSNRNNKNDTFTGNLTIIR